MNTFQLILCWILVYIFGYLLSYICATAMFYSIAKDSGRDKLDSDEHKAIQWISALSLFSIVGTIIIGILKSLEILCDYIFFKNRSK